MKVWDSEVSLSSRWFKVYLRLNFTQVTSAISIFAFPIMLPKSTLPVMLPRPPTLPIMLPRSPALPIVLPDPRAAYFRTDGGRRDDGWCHGDRDEEKETVVDLHNDDVLCI